MMFLEGPKNVHGNKKTEKETFLHVQIGLSPYATRLRRHFSMGELFSYIIKISLSMQRAGAGIARNPL